VIVQWSNIDHEQKCPKVPFQWVAHNKIRVREKLGKAPQLSIRGLCVHQPSQPEKRLDLNFFVSTPLSFTNPEFLIFVIFCFIIIH